MVKMMLISKNCYLWGWPKSLFGFFHNILQKNANDLFGQPNTNKPVMVSIINSFSCQHYFMSLVWNLELFCLVKRNPRDDFTAIQ